MENTYNTKKKPSFKQDEEQQKSSPRISRGDQSQSQVSEAGSSPVTGIKNLFSSISLPELALIGAAGFVVWKNRAKIQNLLEENGIDVPFLHGDFGQMLQSGLNLFNGGEQKEGIHNKH